MTYISIKNHSALTGLNPDNIVEIMLTGVNFLDASILTYVSKIDGINEEIMFDEASLRLLKRKVKEKDFSVSIVGSVVKIENDKMPPSLFFLLDNWIQILENHINYDSTYNILIPHRNKGPMFIGEQTVIERLSDNFDGNYDIIVLKDIEKG